MKVPSLALEDTFVSRCRYLRRLLKVSSKKSTKKGLTRKSTLLNAL